MRRALLGLLATRATAFSVRRTARFSVVDRAMATDCTTTEAERAEAAALRSAGGGAGVAPDVAGCVLGEGTQKYVLVRAGDRYFVRGDVRADYHKDAARPLVEELRAREVEYEVLGGGRIALDAAARTIRIYGHSFGFPWRGEFRHDLAARVCEAAYPGFDVETSNEGY